MSKNIFEQIKKQNGEAFAQAVSSYLDIPDIVKIVEHAGREPKPLLRYLFYLRNKLNTNTQLSDIKDILIDKNPFELLNEAGYNAYYVTNLEQQNAISKYFEPNEMLCTFKDTTRFNRYHIINAVKKDVDTINRKDFFGKDNLIPNGDNFYLIGELDPSGKSISNENWPTYHALPPYNADGTDNHVERVFIQDFMTTANFVIGEWSLQYAYLTVPDLRSSSVTLGLSVDVKWSTGITFDNVVVGGNTDTTPETPEP